MPLSAVVFYYFLISEVMLMSKRIKILTGAAAALLALLLLSTTVMSAIMLVNQAKVNDMISVYTGQTEDPAQEDDVVIGQHYVIKSTTHISDAYKSGDTSKLDDRDKETLAMAKEVIKSVIKKGMSDYEKEEAIYEYLTKGMKATTNILTVISDTSTDNDNPHDVLKNHSAVCVGYATTFRMFMQMFGIDCKVVHNTSLSHSWDLVKLEDGWYHTDCYMDNNSSSRRNFNMDQQRCRQEGHEWNTEFFPAATGKKYNYVLMNSKQIKNIDAIPKAVIDKIKQRESCFSFTFKEAIKPEDELTAQYTVDQLNSALGNSDRFFLSSMWTTNDKGAYVLCYFVSFVDENQTTLSQEERDRIDQRINDIIEKSRFYETINGDVPNN